MTITITDLIHEYDQSLTRMDGEKDLQKKIIERAHGELNIDPAAFRLAAAAYHKDMLQKTLEQLQSQSDLLESLLDKNDAPLSEKTD